MKKNLTNIVLVVILLVGAAILLYPSASDYWNSFHQSRAIASYSEARDVNRVRVVFCDAAPYDQGYMEAADIAGSVKVRGRGGTVLQPGVELLEHASDFPKEAPLLIITDCECDRLNLYGRDHAFLVPRGRSLPFPPKGPVFYLE